MFAKKLQYLLRKINCVAITTKANLNAAQSPAKLIKKQILLNSIKSFVDK